MPSNDPQYAKRYYETHRAEATERARKYRERNREKIRERSKAWRAANRESDRKSKRKYYRNLRLRGIALYGGGCACCDETEMEFLSLHHVKGQKGKKREKGETAWLNAIRIHDPSTYCILCHNCNQAIAHLGYCPHQKSQNQEDT